MDETLKPCRINTPMEVSVKDVFLRNVKLHVTNLKTQRLVGTESRHF